MGVTRELFRVFCHSRVRRGQIREVEVNGLQQTEFSPDDVRHFSGGKERHVAQKLNPLCACEHAIVLLTPFKSAESWLHRCPCWRFLSTNHSMSLATSIGGSSFESRTG